MATKYNKPEITPTSPNSIYGAHIPKDFELPPCGIEDVDRAIFKLFDGEIPLYSESKGKTERIPVIFATGERAFILRRNKPLTDRSGALILPLVSILRSGLDQGPTAGGFGVGPGDGSLTIYKRVHRDSIDYYNEKNVEGLMNQRNVVTAKKHVGASIRGYRRSITGATIKNTGGTPVTEIITIPSPRYFSATYDITFWAQYLQQMNEMLEAMMSSYTHNPSRTFKLETDKGYWFVAHVDAALTGDLNFDSMTDAERIVKYNFSISVNGYIINPKFPGSQTTLRHTLSAPKISFDSSLTNSSAQTIIGVPSGRPEDYVNADFDNEDAPLPGVGVGGVTMPSVGPTGVNSMTAAAVTSTTGVATSTRSAVAGSVKTTIGNTRSQDNTEYIRTETFIDPFTGEKFNRKVLVKSKRSRYGETVHSMLSIKD